jgi:hypothetical protein
MKKIFTITSLILVLAAGLLQAQDKATLSSFRILAKPGKDEALKKAIAAHAAKYHTGNWKWRVFNVLSGAEEGAYMINEGPNSWTDLEGRKDISDEHSRDYENSVLPLVEKTLPHGYLTYQRQYSTDSAGGSFKKALLRHIYLKPGKGQRYMNHLATWKKVWEKLGLKTAVWASFFSGQPQVVIASRLPNGFVDLEKSWGKEMREAFDELEGTGAHVRYLEDLSQFVDRVDEEIIELMPELSSK